MVSEGIGDGLAAGLDFEPFIAALRVIPVVEIPRVDDAVPLARALVDAGLPCV